jgi:hypothetical protein
VSTAGLAEKFRALVTPRYDPALADRALPFVQDIEHAARITTALREMLPAS